MSSDDVLNNIQPFLLILIFDSVVDNIPPALIFLKNTYKLVPQHAFNNIQSANPAGDHQKISLLFVMIWHTFRLGEIDVCSLPTCISNFDTLKADGGIQQKVAPAPRSLTLAGGKGKHRCGGRLWPVETSRILLSW